MLLEDISLEYERIEFSGNTVRIYYNTDKLEVLTSLVKDYNSGKIEADFYYMGEGQTTVRIYQATPNERMFVEQWFTIR